MDLRRLMIFSLNCMVCLLVLTVRERVRPPHQYVRRRGIWQATMVGNLSTGTNVAEIPPTQAKTGLQKGTGFGAAAVPASYWHGGSFLLAFPASYKTFSLSYRLLKNAHFIDSMNPMGPNAGWITPAIRVSKS